MKFPFGYFQGIFRCELLVSGRLSSTVSLRELAAVHNIPRGTVDVRSVFPMRRQCWISSHLYVSFPRNPSKIIQSYLVNRSMLGTLKSAQSRTFGDVFFGGSSSSILTRYDWMSRVSLGGGFNFFKNFHPAKLRKIPNLTSIFFRLVETTNQFRSFFCSTTLPLIS